MDDVETKVRSLVSRVTDRPVDSIRDHHRLLDDLGIDGDDAVILFDLYDEAFGLDLSDLRWSRHFGPEGVPIVASLGIFLLGLVGGLLAAIAGLPGWAAGAFAVAGVVIWVGPMRTWPMKRVHLIPITVGDLINSAKAGRWISLNDRPAER